MEIYSSSSKKSGERERMALLLRAFIFPAPSSLFVLAMSMISFTSMANAGASEFMGRHLPYSKFSAVAGQDVKQRRISSRAGMLLLYAPAMIAAASAGVCDLVHGLRAQLVAGALVVHFAKRVLEVLFLHDYSGTMILRVAICISSSYFLSTVTTIYSQHLAGQSTAAEPAFDSKPAGVLLFTVGVSGNFYHHYLLSKLRKNGEKAHKIPKGGLFGLVVCPHYLFEIIGFVGISLISQTVYALSVAIGTAAYLSGRSWSTKLWYFNAFKDFPRDRKALLPYVF